MNPASRHLRPLRLAFPALIILFTSLGCSLGQTLVGEPTPTPTNEPVTLLPTWTPSPASALSPADRATLTVVAGLIFPTLTPTPTPDWTPTPTPTSLPTPTPLPSPTPEPTPYIVVSAPTVNVRSGPSIAYPIIGQVRLNETYQLIGRNDTLTWWQICCVDGQQGWITTELTAPGGPVEQVPIASAPPAPPTPIPVDTPIPQPTAPPTNTPAPVYAFSLSEGPELWQTNNAWLTIWLNVWAGREPIRLAVPGVRLKVLRNGGDVSPNELTADRFQLSAPEVRGEPFMFGNRREYNLKYEYMPEAGNAEWTIWLEGQNGTQLSAQHKFQTTGGQEVFVSFHDDRP